MTNTSIIRHETNRYFDGVQNVSECVCMRAVDFAYYGRQITEIGASTGGG